MDDLQIIEYILDGKKDYFAQLMNKYHNEIFSFIFNTLGNYQDTEDLVQDVFLKIYSNLKKYNKNKASFRTWMYRISSNEMMNYLNSSYYKKKANYELETGLLVSGEDIESETIKEETVSHLVSIMKNVLKDKHLEIMTLHYFSNLSVKEISKTMEIPEKTIYKALKSSIEKIKKEVHL